MSVMESDDLKAMREWLLLQGITASLGMEGAINIFMEGDYGPVTHRLWWDDQDEAAGWCLKALEGGAPDNEPIDSTDELLGWLRKD